MTPLTPEEWDRLHAEMVAERWDEWVGGGEL